MRCPGPGLELYSSTTKYNLFKEDRSTPASGRDHCSVFTARGLSMVTIPEARSLLKSASTALDQKYPALRILGPSYNKASNPLAKPLFCFGCGSVGCKDPENQLLQFVTFLECPANLLQALL